MKDTKNQPQGRRVATWQLAVLITLAVALVLTSTLWIWWACADVESFPEGWTLLANQFDEPENDIHYKDCYTVSDKKAQKWQDKTVATTGPAMLSNAALQVYYWMTAMEFLSDNGYYVTSLGFDYNQPLSEQYYSEYGGTWEQYFLEQALQTWNNYQAMALMAQASGLELTAAMQSDLDNLRLMLAQSAVDGGYASMNEMLTAEMGAGCTYEGYQGYMQTYYQGYLYFETQYNEASAAVTDEVLEQYYTQNQEAINEDGIDKTSGSYYSVRHILIMVGDGDSESYTDEEWTACQTAAQKVLDEWLAGDKTEESFAELANAYSDDTGSNTNGGLYTELTADTQLVDPFKNWYLDESREVGDYELVKTDYGYHVMYFSGAEAQWKAVCREAILTNVANDIVTTATDRYPMEVAYKDIALGYVALTDSVVAPEVKTGWQYWMLGITVGLLVAGAVVALICFRKKK